MSAKPKICKECFGRGTVRSGNARGWRYCTYCPAGKAKKREHERYCPHGVEYDSPGGACAVCENST